MANNEVEIIDDDITELTARPQQNGGLLDTNTDNIIYLANKADQYIAAIDERDVKMAAYTNCLNNGIKRLIPNLRNIDVATLENSTRFCQARSVDKNMVESMIAQLFAEAHYLIENHLNG